MNLIAYIAAVVCFCLAALGVDTPPVSPAEWSYIGLALFALGHVLPG